MSMSVLKFGKSVFVGKSAVFVYVRTDGVSVWISDICVYMTLWMSGMPVSFCLHGQV